MHQDRSLSHWDICFHCRILFHCKDVSEFIYLPVRGHLGCCQLPVIKKSVTINICNQVFMCTYVFISFGQIPKSQTAGSRGKDMLTFINWIAKVFPRFPFTSWPNVHRSQVSMFSLMSDFYGCFWCHSEAMRGYVAEPQWWLGAWSFHMGLVFSIFWWLLYPLFWHPAFLGCFLTVCP